MFFFLFLVLRFNPIPHLANTSFQHLCGQRQEKEDAKMSLFDQLSEGFSHSEPGRLFKAVSLRHF